MKSSYETVDRIRRSHRHAQPNPAENPAWANCHMDCGVLLDYITELENTTILRDQIDDLMSQVSRLSARKAQLEAALRQYLAAKQWDDIGACDSDAGKLLGASALETKGNDNGV